MKKIVLTVAIGLALSSTFALAQQKRQDKGDRMTRTEAKAKATPEMRAERTAERMSRELSLTAEQRKEVYDISLRSYKEAKPTAEGRKAQNAAIDKVLTADQKALKVQLENDKKAKMESRRAERSIDLKERKVMQKQ